MTILFRLIAVGTALYAIFASSSVAEETNSMVWALWIYGISIAMKLEEMDAKTKEDE